MSVTPDMSGLRKLSELLPDPTLQEAILTIHRLSKRIASVEQPGLRRIILDFSGVNSTDAAVAVETLEELIEDMVPEGSAHT